MRLSFLVSKINLLNLDDLASFSFKCHEDIILKFKVSPFSQALSYLLGTPFIYQMSAFPPISHLTKGLLCSGLSLTSSTCFYLLLTLPSHGSFFRTSQTSDLICSNDDFNVTSSIIYLYFRGIFRNVYLCIFPFQIFLQSFQH